MMFKQIKYKENKKVFEDFLTKWDRARKDAHGITLKEERVDAVKRGKAKVKKYRKLFAKHTDLIREHRLIEATVNYQESTAHYTGNYFIERTRKEQLEAEIARAKSELETYVKNMAGIYD